jgi:hypothetical protein
MAESSLPRLTEGNRSPLNFQRVFHFQISPKKHRVDLDHMAAPNAVESAAAVARG